MAATVLNSSRAVEVSVYVVRAFIPLRELAASHRGLAKRLDDLEQKTEALALKQDTFSRNTRIQLKEVFDAPRSTPAAMHAPDLLLDLITVTFSHCMPTIMHMVLSTPADSDLRGWKTIGGSALPRGLAAATIARGIEIFTGYGMSETCPVLTLAQTKTPLAGDAARELDVRTKTGLPIRLVDLRIVNEELRDVAHHGKSRSPGESWCGRRG